MLKRMNLAKHRPSPTFRLSDLRPSDTHRSTQMAPGAACPAGAKGRRANPIQKNPPQRMHCGTKHASPPPSTLMLDPTFPLQKSLIHNRQSSRAVGKSRMGSASPHPSIWHLVLGPWPFEPPGLLGRGASLRACWPPLPADRAGPPYQRFPFDFLLSGHPGPARCR